MYSWAKLFPTCGGSQQSPIDLPTPNTTYDPSLEPFTFSGLDTDDGTGWTLTNNGHTVQADRTSGQPLQVWGGSLGGTFQVKQFHWHWGAMDSEGSEHTVNAKHYPMEIHIVCFNTKYADIGTAVLKPDGIAVLAFLYEISDEKINSEMESIAKSLHAITEPSNNVLSPKKLSLKALMGATDRYYRYKGSLTTPLCNEVVTWTVFKDTVPISSSQISEFRRLKDAHAHSLAGNFRPVQSLNGRPLTANFRDQGERAPGGKPTAAPHREQQPTLQEQQEKEEDSGAAPGAHPVGPQTGLVVDTDLGSDDEVMMTKFDRSFVVDNSGCVCV